MTTIYYTVEPGDTLWGIAQYFGTTVNDIARYNGLAFPDKIFPGQQLRIPTTAGQAPMWYVVRPGDTLWTIAQRYGTTVATLASLNQIQHPDLIFPGQTLRIPIQSAAAQYTVQPGDTLWAIARQYHTSVETLVQLNRISNPDLIYPGQVLTLSAA